MSADTTTAQATPSEASQSTPAAAVVDSRSGSHHDNNPPSPPSVSALSSSATTPPLPPSFSNGSGDLPPPPPPPPPRNNGSGSKQPGRRSRSASRERRRRDGVPKTISGQINGNGSNGNSLTAGGGGIPPPPQYPQASPPQYPQQGGGGGGQIPPPPPPSMYSGYGGGNFGYPPSPHYPPGHQQLPPPPPQMVPTIDSYQSYGRGRAWSGDYTGQQGQGTPPPPPPYPLHPQNLYSYPPQQGGHRRIESNSGTMSVGGHRRVDSNGSVGSFHGGSMIGPPASPRTGGEFSARNEFFAVTGIRPESPRTTTTTYPPPSPRGGMHYRQMTPPQYASPMHGSIGAPHGSPLIGVSIPPYSPGMALVPELSPAAGPYRQPCSHLTGSDHGDSIGRNSGSIGRNSGSIGRSSGGMEGYGGEAVFLAQRKGKHEHSRRRHMRQQAAQTFMEQIKGQPQPLICRDLIWLLLFAFHLTYMVYLSNTYSYVAIAQDNPPPSVTIVEDSENIQIYYPNLLIVAIFCGGFAVCLSTVLFTIMTYFARRFVQVALCVIISLSFIWGTVGIGLSPKNIVPITGIIALALSLAYTIIVWDRIPFAASNLLTALSAVRAYPGTVLVAIFFQLLGIGWCIYYSIIVMGIYDSIHNGRIELSDRMTVFAYIGLAFSFYWTYQVLLNAVQVATAGVVGAWWYEPEGEHTAKTTTFMTLFYSLGSICFGSLLVGPVRVIQQFSVFFRPSTDESRLLCLYECLQCIRSGITSCVDGLAARCNPWAFTYVGLYHYSFWEGGQLATELFDMRGWTTIVSDDLVPNILLMTALVVGGITGCFGYILAGLEDLRVTSLDEPGLISFAIGIIIGVVATSILFGAISSAVNAAIVCFASSPGDFENNHPELSLEMRSAWREVWPGALDVMDVRIAMAQAQNNGNVNGVHPLLNGETMPLLH